MTDTERDPTRTEDVEKYEYNHRPGEDDALDAIEVLRAYADNPDGASQFADEFAEDAASEIRDLRSRLEEAVREAKDILECFHTRTVEGGACDRCKALRRLRCALDSREDEGDEPEITFRATECNDDPITAPLSEVQEHQSWPVCSACNSITCREPVGEVPGLTEPEGDEESVFCKCGHPTYCHVATGISDDGYRHGKCRACDECSEFRPTDEPEGDVMNEVERLCRECGETWTVHTACGQSWSLCPDCRPPEPTDELVSGEGVGDNLVSTWQCKCGLWNDGLTCGSCGRRKKQIYGRSPTDEPEEDEAKISLSEWEEYTEAIQRENEELKLIAERAEAFIRTMEHPDPNHDPPEMIEAAERIRQNGLTYRRLKEAVVGTDVPTDEPVSGEGVYDEVRAERRRQDTEWGPPAQRTHLSATDLSAIVAEEAGELAEAALESDFAGSQSSEKGLDLRREAIQVAASGVLVAEILDAGGPLDDGSTPTHADKPEGDDMSKIEDSTMLEPLGRTVARISCIHHDGAKDRAAHEAVAKMAATGHPLCEPCVNGVLRVERGLRDDPPTGEERGRGSKRETERVHARR